MMAAIRKVMRRIVIPPKASSIALCPSAFAFFLCTALRLFRGNRTVGVDHAAVGQNTLDFEDSTSIWCIWLVGRFKRYHIWALPAEAVKKMLARSRANRLVVDGLRFIFVL